MLLFIVTLVLVISVLRMVYFRKVVKMPFIISIICFALITVHFGGVMLNRDTLNQEVIQKIANIPWDNDEYLYRHRFVKDGETMWLNKLIELDDNLDTTFFCVYVEKADIEQVKKQPGMKSKNNVFYSYKRSSGYQNIFMEFIGHADTASRFYTFYVNDRLVSVREHNEKNTEKLFEQYIMSM